MSYTDKASKIINSEVQTIDDIVELSKIAFNMSVLYKDASLLSAKQEQNYKLTEKQESVNARQTGKSITESESIGKLEAEKQYGDYREMEAECDGMKAIMKAISDFKMSWFVKNKENVNFYSDNRNMGGKM